MPDQIGNVIISGDIGESRVDSDFVSVSSLTGGTVESENVIFGEPDSRTGSDSPAGGPGFDGGIAGTPRKRGRPRKYPDAGNGFNPQNATDGLTVVKERRKALSLENVLMNLHMLIADIADMPEVKLESGEAKEFGDALKEVQKEYGLAFSSKTSALVDLVGVMGKIYVPMGIQVRNRMKSGAPRPPRAGTVAAPKKSPIEMKANGVPPVPTTRSADQMSPSDMFGPQDAGLGPSA